MAEKYEQIKTRMFRNAARMWGINSREDETSFDPLVGLLIESLASEIEGLSREIGNSHLRVTQKLIELMNPEINSGVFPAHAIARATPTEPELTISPNTKFTCKTQKSHSSKYGLSNTMLIPSGKFKLFDASLELILANNKVLTPKQNRPLEYNNTSNNYKLSIKPNQIWLGLKISKQIKDLKDLSIYFNIDGDNESKYFSNQLNQAEWRINNKSIPFINGLKISEYNQNILDKKLEGKTARIDECFDEVRSFHNNNFRTISESVIIKKLPTSDTNPQFSKSELNDLDILPKELIWISIDFKQNLRPEIIDNLSCCINAFPVINLVQKSIQVKAREHLNLIPLNTNNDYFFAIKRIEDSIGDIYNENITFSKSRKKHKSYVLRSDGIQSFDDRSARELLTTVIEKLKNENAAFRFLDVPSVSEDIITLHQLVSKLETKMGNSPELKRPVYLYLEGSTNKDNIFIDFWTSIGSIGNNITPEANLEILEGSDIISGSIQLLTNTRGGLDQLNKDEQLNEYRKALLTRDRIVTNEDLKAFCKVWFGDILTSVEIKKGITILKGTAGLVRCIEIQLETNASFKENDDTRMWCKDFLVHLQKRSSNSFPFKLFIDKKLMEQ